MIGGAPSPEDLLNEARDHPEWDEDRTGEQVERLIALHPPDQLTEAVGARLGALHEPDGEIVLRLVEALSQPEIFDALAEALLAQPDLPPDRLWYALGILEGTGTIESRPRLSEMREELEELLADDRSIEELAHQLESDPDSIAVAVEGLLRVEPEVRAEILAELAAGPRGRGVDELLRRFAEPESTAFPDPRQPAPVPALKTVRIVRSLVGQPDRDGTARVLLLSETPEGWVVAMASCNVLDGIREVAGSILEDRPDAEAAFARLEGDAATLGVQDHHPLAVRLVAGSAWLGGADARTDRGDWLVRAIGPRFRPLPLLDDYPGDDFGTTPIPNPAAEAGAILDLRPSWRDDSEILRDLAEELAWKDGDMTPDPTRDPGPFRILFEQRILGRIALYQGMLLWSALTWRAGRRDDLARSARSFAAQLGDPQNSVPGHPFLSAFMVRSLAAVQDERRRAASRARPID